MTDISIDVNVAKLKGQQRVGNLNIPSGIDLFYPKEAKTYSFCILPYRTTRSKFTEPGNYHFMSDYFVWRGLGPDFKDSVVCNEDIGEKCPIRAYINGPGASLPDDNKPRLQRMTLLNVWFPDTGKIMVFDFAHAKFASTFLKLLETSKNSPRHGFVSEFYKPNDPVIFDVGFEEKSVGKSKFITCATIMPSKLGKAVPAEIMEAVADLDLMPVRLSATEIESAYLGVVHDAAVTEAVVTQPIKVENTRTEPAPVVVKTTEAKVVTTAASYVKGDVAYIGDKKVEVVRVNDDVAVVVDDEGDSSKVNLSTLTKEPKASKPAATQTVKETVPASADSNAPWDAQWEE